MYGTINVCNNLCMYSSEEKSSNLTYSTYVNSMSHSQSSVSDRGINLCSSTTGLNITNYSSAYFHSWVFLPYPKGLCAKKYLLLQEITHLLMKVSVTSSSLSRYWRIPKSSSFSQPSISVSAGSVSGSSAASTSVLNKLQADAGLKKKQKY